MIKSYYVVLFIFLIGNLVQAQPNKKQTEAAHLHDAPKIDGVLNESLWESLPVLTNFVQYVPYNGKEASQKSEVKVGYYNDAIYVGALLFDTAADSILTELGKRDDGNDLIADQFSVHIRPFNDGLNSFYFMVSASGVQTDRIYFDGGMDQSWDAVWESDVKITDNGWTVEIKIPYSAIRFSDKPIQDWGFNVFRYVRRYEEWDSWSFVSREIDQWWGHIGLLKNIKNINPPTRISFSPYVSGYLEKNTSDGWGYSYNGGMDLKYGINESFTLDLTLIPDFGQVQSDDQVLNLTPYEIQYNEKRQFFTEGTELFNTADLFYSRRIGDTPAKYDLVENNLRDNEKIDDNPDENQLINATKISGKTKSGLGIGFFNAMTSPTRATVKDTITGETRKIETQPFTNYNLVVLEQALRNNSSVSLINTSVKRTDYLANVAGSEFRLTNRKNNYEFRGKGAVSHINDDDTTSTGYYYYLEAGKTSGQIKYEYSLSVMDDKYNPNDLGYLRRNNEIIHRFDFEYNIYNPFSKFLDLYNQFSVQHTQLYSPQRFSEVRFDYEILCTLKNYLEFDMHTAWFPLDTHDFFESRLPGKVFVLPKALYNYGGFWTDRRKPFYIGLHGGFLKSYSYDPERFTYWYQAEPSYRINDRIIFSYLYFFRQHQNEVGYVDADDENGDIYFGRRNWRILENTIEANYIFNTKASLDFRLRHYWSEATYDKFYNLKNDGYIEDSDYMENHDKNYNAFTVDMVFTWNFAPGSELLLVWKNSIDREVGRLDRDYFKTLGNTLDAPQVNSLSLKLLYYLDYQKIKKKLF